jgi:hypothetical protein
MAAQPLDYQNPEPPGSGKPFNGWAIVAIASAVFGLIVLPMSGGSSWLASFVFWSAAGVALMIHVVPAWARRRGW